MRVSFCFLLLFSFPLDFVAGISEARKWSFIRGLENPPSCNSGDDANPFPGECGRRHKWSQAKRSVDSDDVIGGNDIISSDDIIGGVAALAGQIPWQVDTNGCGATVVTPRHLVTAAHCLTGNTSMEGRMVVVGNVVPLWRLYHSTSMADFCGAQIRKVVKAEKHPDYCGKEGGCNGRMFNQNDVAVLTLDEPLCFTATVQPACLPRAGAVYKAGTKMLVSGFGYINYKTKKKPKQLQMVSVPVVDRKRCIEQMGEITADMLCAGLDGGGKDACVGDSGGPLVELKGTARMRATLTGVVSWGIDCGKPGRSGVYTSVSNFVPWIKAKINHSDRDGHRLKEIATSGAEDRRPLTGNIFGVLYWAAFLKVVVGHFLCHGKELSIRRT